jgi:hypothetical protein
MVNDEIQKRIREYIDSPVLPYNQTIRDMNQVVKREEFALLNSRAKNLAMHMALYPKQSYQQWANYFGVSFGTIQNYMLDPRMKALVEELTTNTMAFLLSVKTMAITEAIKQMLRIFDYVETADTIETKRKAAMDMLYVFGQLEGHDKKSKNPPPVNINIEGNATVSTGEEEFEEERDVTPENVDIDIVSLKEDLEELEKTKHIRKLAEKYGER